MRFLVGACGLHREILIEMGAALLPPPKTLLTVPHADALRAVDILAWGSAVSSGRCPPCQIELRLVG